MREEAFFLTVGEQAPFKSVSEVYALTAKEREAWVQKLSDLYKTQKEEMEKMNRKSRRK